MSTERPKWLHVSMSTGSAEGPGREHTVVEATVEASRDGKHWVAVEGPHGVPTRGEALFRWQGHPWPHARLRLSSGEPSSDVVLRIPGSPGGASS